MNMYMVFVSALIPLITGWIWYNPKVFGTAWMKVTGFDPSKADNSKMGLIFFLCYVFSILLSLQMMSLTIHQTHIFSLYADTPGAKDAGSEMMMLLEKHAGSYRTFKHGAFHGFLSAIIFVLPIIGIISLFERRGAKYIFIHTGYWALTMMLMGGLLCATV